MTKFFIIESWIFFIFALVILSGLILIFFSDAKYFVIPTIYLYMILAVYILYGVYSYFFSGLYINDLYIPYTDHLWGALLMIAFFGIIHFGSGGKMMGDGDIYLAGLLGLILGLDLSIMMWFCAFFVGAIFSLILIGIKKVTSKDIIPFGPFIIIGALIAILFGNQIILYIT